MHSAVSEGDRSQEETATGTAFFYGGSIGLRCELTSRFYLESSFNEVWIDFDRVGTESFSEDRFNLGWRF